MKRNWILCAALLAGLLCGCGAKEAEEPPVQEEPGAMEQVTAGNAQEMLEKLSTEEKVGQLFLVRPDALDLSLTPQQLEDADEPGLTQVSADNLETLKNYPVGGFVLFGKNLQDPDQLAQLMTGLSRGSQVPLLFAVDEEGGTVSRIANSGGFDVPQFSDMATIGASGDPAKAKEVGSTIGGYLRGLGFQWDFAPVADVNTNPDNPVIGSRAFSSSPEEAAMMISAVVEGFHEGGVACTLKHFPGHGDTAQDSHKGYASTDKTWQEMLTCEMYPFQAGMAAGADAVMVGHITTPNATQDGLPASLSHEMISEKLRGELRFQRVVVTDSLSMEAITDAYAPGQAALMALEAGADVLLMPASLSEAYDAVLAAVQDGTISQARLDQSVLRILQLKENYGLL